VNENICSPRLGCGTPEEAAGAVLLFCLPESDYISGEIVVAVRRPRM
jgi:3-oxoacyl-[acyl-carrier protein] reductase